MNKKNKSEIGRKSRATGKRFEARVRKDLEEKGWIVDRWTNNLEFEDSKKGKLVPTKPKFIFNPKTKTRQIIGNNPGFPDFICFKENKNSSKITGIVGPEVKKFDVIGIESKSGKYLDAEEKLKCEWYLKNDIFSKIFIAHKSKKRGEIGYKEFA